MPSVHFFLSYKKTLNSGLYSSFIHRVYAKSHQFYKLFIQKVNKKKVKWLKATFISFYSGGQNHLTKTGFKVKLGVVVCRYKLGTVYSKTGNF